MTDVASHRMAIRPRAKKKPPSVPTEVVSRSTSLAKPEFDARRIVMHLIPLGVDDAEIAGTLRHEHGSKLTSKEILDLITRTRAELRRQVLQTIKTAREDQVMRVLNDTRVSREEKRHGHTIENERLLIDLLGTAAPKKVAVGVGSIEGLGAMEPAVAALLGVMSAEEVATLVGDGKPDD